MSGEDLNSVKTITVTAAERALTKPKYSVTTAELLERCRTFYQDPENERAYMEWKEKQKKGA